MESQLAQIDIVAVGDPNPLIGDTLTRYQELLGQLVQLRVAEIPGQPATAQRDMPISDEARRVAATVEAIEAEHGGRFPILMCDYYGDNLTSPEFASKFLPLPYLCVIVGGIFGLHETLPDRDMRRVSFGRITLSPSLARLVITDQLYRVLRSGRELPYDLN